MENGGWRSKTNIEHRNAQRAPNASEQRHFVPVNSQPISRRANLGQVWILPFKPSRDKKRNERHLQVGSAE